MLRDQQGLERDQHGRMIISCKAEGSRINKVEAKQLVVRKIVTSVKVTAGLVIKK